MRLTDEQVREIESRRDDSSAEPRDEDTWLSEFGLDAINDRVALLADREALLAEIAELKTRMAEGFSARDGQIENGAKMIAELQAENAKLRKVAECLRSLIGPTELLTWRTIEADDHEVIEARDLLAKLEANYALEPTNVPDATDDKNRGTQQRGLRGIWSSVE